MSDPSDERLKELSNERLAQLDDGYFHLRKTGVAPNVEWDDFRERESAYHELILRREAMRGVDQGTHVVVPQKLMQKIDVYLSIINPWDESAQTKLRGEVKSAMLAAALSGKET